MYVCYIYLVLYLYFNTSIRRIRLLVSVATAAADNVVADDDDDGSNDENVVRIRIPILYNKSKYVCTFSSCFLLFMFPKYYND